MKICYYCGGTIKQKRIRYIHEWGDKIIIFENLPVEVCSQCGEKYLSPDIIEMIDKVTATTKAKKYVKIPVVSVPEKVGV